MSDIGLILNGLLGVLLVGALALGWRLEGRLKALRASQLSFAKAVEDLDRAAARAEQGLADLRAATDEAAESLAGRIERAKSLTVRLEALTGQATNIEARLGRSLPERDRPVLARGDDDLSPRRAAPGRELAASRAAAPRAASTVRADLILEDDAPAHRETPAAAKRLQRLRNLAALRGRLRGEEDIGAAAPPRRAAGGAR